MTWVWVEQAPHRNVINGTTIHILVNDDVYEAFIAVEVDGFRAMVPKPKGEESLSYYYTHDTLQEAKDWCVVELVKRRLDT